MQMACALAMIVAVVAACTGTTSEAAPADDSMPTARAAGEAAPSLRRSAPPAPTKETPALAIENLDLNDAVEELSLSDVSLLGLQRSVKVVKKARRTTR
mmetsp:Transcript_120801/g.349036  ORF Transcript_120801/g.349036 Transcript_120801/m.349036 type:complete len:99 (+) Transcript_120801:47-343(+)